MMEIGNFAPADREQIYKRWMTWGHSKGKSKDLKKKIHRKMAKKSRRANRR